MYVRQGWRNASLLQIDKEKINIRHTLKSKRHEQAFIEVTLKKHQTYESMLKIINKKEMQTEKNSEVHKDKKTQDAHGWLGGLAPKHFHSLLRSKGMETNI